MNYDTYESIAHLGSERVISGIYLTYYEDDSNSSGIIYDVSQLQLSCTLAIGGSSGVSCSVSITGTGHRIERDYKYPWLQYPDTAEDNELSPFIFMTDISIGKMAEVVIEYTESDSDEVFQDVIIQGKVVSVNRAIQSQKAGALSTTTVVVSTAWDSFVCIPPSNLYMAPNNGFRALIKETNANLRSGNMIRVATTLANEDSSNGFNVARLAAAMLDNSGNIQKWGSLTADDYKTGKLESMINSVSAPRLLLVNPKESSISLALCLFRIVASNILSVEPKSLLFNVLQTFYMTAAPRQTDDGRWEIAILPDNMWDDPVDIDITVSKERKISMVTPSILLGVQRVDQGLPTSDRVEVGVRYSGHKGSNLQTSVVVYGESVKGELRTMRKITMDSVTKKAKAVDENGEVVEPLQGLIIADLPDWLKYTAYPTDVKDLKDNREYEEKWAGLLARALFARKDRLNSILVMQLPIVYYRDFIAVLGKCIAVTLTNKEELEGENVFIGRVENVTLTIELENTRFTGILNVSINGVHTAEEHKVLRVPSTELFEIPKERDR